MAKKERGGRAVEQPAFESVRDRIDFAAQLELLEIYVVRGSTAKVLDEETAPQVKYHLQEAREQAMKDNPVGELVVDHLENARDRVVDMNAEHDMIETLEEAVSAARRLF